MTEANIKQYHQSVGLELQAIKDRVRNLIGDAHWGEEGHYKEAILKNSISRFLPADISIGTGFVVLKENERIKPTKQIDLILYDNSYPTLFREGDFVILTPEPIMGIIEVKTKIRQSGKNSLGEILKKSYENARMIIKASQNSRIFSRFFNGIFSYDSEIGYRAALNAYQSHKPYNDDVTIQKVIEEIKPVVSNICLNQDIFMTLDSYREFAAYRLEKLAPAYFISYLLYYLKNKELGAQKLWFALSDKAEEKVGSVNPLTILQAE